VPASPCLKKSFVCRDILRTAYGQYVAIVEIRFAQHKKNVHRPYPGDALYTATGIIMSAYYVGQFSTPRKAELQKPYDRAFYGERFPIMLILYRIYFNIAISRVASK
jgi:hypothetical protein